MTKPSGKPQITNITVPEKKYEMFSATQAGIPNGVIPVTEQDISKIQIDPTPRHSLDIGKPVMRFYPARSATTALVLMVTWTGVVGVPSVQTSPTITRIPLAINLVQEDEFMKLQERFGHPLTRDDYDAITTRWEETNDRRVDLIFKKAESGLTDEEFAEFEHLQMLADAQEALSDSGAYDHIEKIYSQLVAEGILPKLNA